MPIRKRPTPASESTEELLDLPLDGQAPPESPAADRSLSGLGAGSPSATEVTRATPPPPRRAITRRKLGEVDAIGSLDRRRGRRGRASWWWLWLVLLLAVPLGVLVGYLLSSDPPIAAVSTDLLDFGEVRLGAQGVEQTLRISNQGEKALRIEAAALAGEAAGEFRIAENGCTDLAVQAQANCALRLTFAPASRGARRAQIRLDSNAPDGSRTVPLIGVGVAPELTVEPAKLDFGPLTSGKTSSALTLRLENRGTAALQLGRIELGGSEASSFRTVTDGCSSRQLTPGDRCSLRFAYAAGAPGASRAELTIESDGGEPKTVPLSGTSTEQLLPIARLETDELDFGSWPVTPTEGTESPSRTVNLTNDGEAPMVVRSVRFEDEFGSGDAAGFEVVTEDCTTGQVSAGGACKIELRFQPTMEGAVQAALAIDSNAAPDPHHVLLTGAGTAPHTVITPARLAFGESAVKATSTPRQMTLSSTGSGPLIVGQVSVTGADASAFVTSGISVRGPCAGTLVAPGGECLFEVRFRPGRAGPHRADLVIEHNAEGGRQVISLNGIGVAARLALDRASVDFGDVVTGEESRQQLTLTNAGRSELKLLRVRLTGRQAGFGLDLAGCAAATGPSGRPLGPSASCTLNVVFRPTEAGLRGLQLVINHSAADRPQEVPVTARATAPSVPQIRLEPASLEFPNRRVGERSTIKTVTVSNPGTARLTFEDLQVLGDHPDDFQLVPGSCAGFVAPGASCTVGIRFVPFEEGQRRAVLAIRHNTGEGSIQLEMRGVGTAPIPAGP